MSKELSGAGVALITPFDENGEIDIASLKKVLNHVSIACHYLVVMGTTGESATLTMEEKSEILSFVKANNSRELPIVYGIGGNNTSAVISEIRNTDLEGVSALLSVSPYYNKPGQKGLISHYTKIADAAPVPVIMYNVPGRTGSNISAETTLHLATHQNIMGIKDATTDMEQILHVAREKPGDFLQISGDDLTYLPVLACGGDGVISVAANAYPMEVASVYENFRKGERLKAAEAAQFIAGVFPLMFSEGNPTGIKAFCAEMGLCQSHVRLPLAEASPTLKNKISDTVKRPG